MLRMLIVSWLIALATAIAPKKMQPVLARYPELMEGMLDQIEKGRTYGVIMLPWWRGADLDSAVRAKGMHERMLGAADSYRKDWP